MYSIVSIIYGVPLTQAVHDRIVKIMDEDPDAPEEADDYGFETMYSGSHDFQPGYCGVRIGGFDECNEWMSLVDKNLRFVPTDDEKAEAEKKLAAIDDRLKGSLEPVGVYFIFSTS